MAVMYLHRLRRHDRLPPPADAPRVRDPRPMRVLCDPRVGGGEGMVSTGVPPTAGTTRSPTTRATPTHPTCTATRHRWAHPRLVARPPRVGFDRDRTSTLRPRPAGRPPARCIDQLYLFWVAFGIILRAVALGPGTGTWHGALAGVLWGGLVRIFLLLHITWSINSVCHVSGPALRQLRRKHQ